MQLIILAAVIGIFVVMLAAVIDPFDGRRRVSKEYRKLAEQAVEAQRATTGLLAELRERLATLDARAAAIEKMLRDVG